ncbi:ATP-dependent transcriptional regulator, MalT- like, LuxR family [Nakamurella multipartita DSM 44233]|uniref:ATP-dependent transcriptional regulator, MalT-like, LuxR family n=2 Tax=Nakamurella TaxID=53460 RepID=C8X673_NAKMY|nr:ATP-dependent transcriptional regulator, MalT- like, LuxR family [Nakamurella multipartita DSM 44233]
MRSPILHTKLYAARVRGRTVPRPRLTEHLTDFLSGGRLLLISAPAGFGKTTTLAQWVQTLSADAATGDRTGTGPAPGQDTGSRGPGDPAVAQTTNPPAVVAWLSLDPADNEPGRFCAYVLTAFQHASPGLGADQLHRLEQQAPATTAADATPMIAELLNDIADLPHDVVLVLEDYHLVESPDVHDQLAYLLEHAPPQLHVAVSTRVDPPLPLARMRVRGELTEIRAADLRFTAAEADTYLNGLMQLGLTQPQVTALGSRAEGWIAALQLAALSMQGRDDVAAFIADFTGDDRYIVDYLAEEVLARQPEQTRRFLLHTAVLDRLTGALCDALTGRDDGRRTLEQLERANMFLVALDNQRRWYRYHHLFADVLRARLLDQQPTLIPQLHLAASRWYADDQQPEDAIRHALAGSHMDLAADLIEQAIEQSLRERTEATMRGWLKQLPPDVVAARPALGIALAGATLATGETAGVAQLLNQAEQRLNAPGDAHADTTGRLPGWVEVYRSGLAQAQHDTRGTLTHARLALQRLDAGDSTGRAAASALVGLASWATGNLQGAHEAYTAAQSAFKATGYLTDVLGCAVVLADIRKTQGRLQSALDTHLEALQYVTTKLHAAEPTQTPPRQGPADTGAAELTGLRGIVDTYIGIADIHRERGNPTEATRLLRLAESAGESAGLPQAQYRRHVVQAQIARADGDLETADQLLQNAQRLYVADFHPDVIPVAATRARLWVAQGRLDGVFAWARGRALALSDEPAFTTEYEHLTLVRAHLAHLSADLSAHLRHHHAADGHPAGDPNRAPGVDQVLGFLDRLLTHAEAGGRTGTVIDALIQRAIALRLAAGSRGNRPGQGTDESLRTFHRALDLAEPQGYARTFLDEGSVVTDLLRDALRAGLNSEYVTALLNQQPHSTTPDLTGTVAPTDAGPQTDRRMEVVVERLSQRELDVLRLLATDLSGPDIARHLVVSLNTIRTHTKNLYAKLGVTNRRAAVRRAEELHLLQGTVPRRA